jgi:hypothetical protein
MIKTDWFPGNIKPVRIGVYEKQIYNERSVFSYWDGAYWFVYSYSVLAALQHRGCKSVFQNSKWRGISK